MILVDSSVWIDYFRGIATPQADRLDSLLGREPLLVGDLILAEILQGISADREFDRVRRLLLTMDVINIGVMGGYRLLHQNPKVQALAVQKPSFRSVLIANPAAFKHNKLSSTRSTPLAILRNQRVAFGSRSSICLWP